MKVTAVLLLAFLLCACGAKPSGTVPAGPATLPVIGEFDIGPGETTTVPYVPSTLPVVTEALPSEEVPSGEESTEAPPATLPPSLETTAPEPTDPPTAPEPTKVVTDGVRVWMGDSRFVGIQDKVETDKEKDVFISGWGQGFNWMVYTAFPAFDRLAAEKKISICYWSLGANDITNDPSEYNFQLAEKYIEQLTKFMEKYPDVTFYLLSYGPVGPEGMDPNNIPDCDAYNSALRMFTDYIFSHTGMLYIDQGEYIERTGFKVYDGCHYDAATNKRAYEYVLRQSGQ